MIRIFISLIKTVYHEIYIRIVNIGKLPLCNLQKHRAPHIFGICFPLCWRCTSAVFSMRIIFPVMLLFLGSFIINYREAFLWISLIFTLPLIIDGTNQYFISKKESTNYKRVITGVLAGLGIKIFLFLI